MGSWILVPSRKAAADLLRIDPCWELDEAIYVFMWDPQLTAECGLRLLVQNLTKMELIIKDLATMQVHNKEVPFAGTLLCCMLYLELMTHTFWSHSVDFDRWKRMIYIYNGLTSSLLLGGVHVAHCPLPLQGRLDRGEEDLLLAAAAKRLWKVALI